MTEEPVEDEQGIQEDSNTGYEMVQVNVEDLLKLSKRLLHGRGEINEYEFKQRYGPDYLQQLESWQKDGYIQYERDTTNQSIILIQPLPPLLDLDRKQKEAEAVEAQRRKEQLKKDALERDEWKRGCRQYAPEDAKKLIQEAEITRGQKSLDITATRLRQIFGIAYLGPLERLQEEKFLTVQWTDEDPFLFHLAFGARLLEQVPRQKPGLSSHKTQLTVEKADGTKEVLDTRNLAALVLSTPERAARSCLFWIDIYNDPETPPKQKTKMHMNLERAHTLWSRGLENQNPGLYLRVMQALGHPEKSGLNPILALDDMEAF